MLYHFLSFMYSLLFFSLLVTCFWLMKFKKSQMYAISLLTIKLFCCPSEEKSTCPLVMVIKEQEQVSTN